MTYPGGKAGAGVYQRIISMMPPHRVYIEPFLGGGAVMRHKRPAERSHGIDLSAAAIAAFDREGLPGLELRRADAFTWLRNYRFTCGELVYMDPPYLKSTRSSRRDIYEHELSDERHAELLNLARDLPCMVMISGYWSEMYAEALGDWRLETFQAITRGGGVALEHVWLNFPEPLELHDYRYLGDGFTDRQRIKRKQERWRRRLAKMPTKERYAMLSVLRELGL